MNDSELVDVISRKLVPFILLFGCYLISHGHLSPDGGFQGGAVLAAGITLLCLSRGVRDTRRTFPLRRVSLTESVAFLVILAMGAIGLVLGRRFLGNFLPLGEPGRIPSALFIFLLNLLIGLKVGAGITVVLLGLLGEEE